MRYLTTNKTNANLENHDRSGRSFFGALAGFVALDAVLLVCLLSPITGLKAAPRVYRLTERPIFSSSPSRDIARPSPFPDAVRVQLQQSASGSMGTPAFVEVGK